MKRLILILTAIIALSSCELYVYENDPPAPLPPPVVYDERDAFMGVFDLEEYSTTFQATKVYEVSVVKSFAADNRIFIQNFYCDGLEVLAFVNGNSFVIPDQYVGNYFITGSGFINGDRLSMDYYLIYDDGLAAFEDSASAVAFRLFWESKEGEGKEGEETPENA